MGDRTWQPALMASAPGLATLSTVQLLPVAYDVKHTQRLRQYIMGEVSKFSAKSWGTSHRRAIAAKNGTPSEAVIWFAAPAPVGD
jgi:hypothetical protein